MHTFTLFRLFSCVGKGKCITSFCCIEKRPFPTANVISQNQRSKSGFKKKGCVEGVGREKEGWGVRRESENILFQLALCHANTDPRKFGITSAFPFLLLSGFCTISTHALLPAVWYSRCRNKIFLCWQSRAVVGLRVLAWNRSGYIELCILRMLTRNFVFLISVFSVYTLYPPNAVQA